MSTVNLSKSQIETIICQAYQQALNDVVNNGNIDITFKLYINDMNTCAENLSQAAMIRYKHQS